MTKRIYTKEEIEKIKKLGYKGVPDVEIAKITGAKYAFVKKNTTKIWADLMARKNEEE